MQSCIRFLFIILLISILHDGLAQSVDAQLSRLEVEAIHPINGLPDAFVTNILEDHQGYLWVATTGGLVRYDGYDFEYLLNTPEDSTSISNNWVEYLFLASDSTIWIGTDHLINHYIPQKGVFESFSKDKHPNLPAKDLFTSIVEDASGNIWFGTQNSGLLCYEKSTKQFQRFLVDPNSQEHLLNDQVRTLLYDSNGYLWIGTGEPFDLNISGGGLLKFSPETGEVKRYMHNVNNQNSLIDNRIGALMEDRQGKIWVGTCKSGLHWYDPQQDNFMRLNSESNNSTGIYPIEADIGVWSGCPLVRIIHEDKQGKIWIGTMNGGIHVFDPITQSLQVYTTDSNEEEGLNTNSVWTIFEDSQERIWIGTITGGLHWADPVLRKFHSLKVQSESQNSLKNKTILCVYQAPSDPQYLWIGTRTDGLYRMNLNTGKAEHFLHHPNDPQSISNDGIWIVFEDSEQTLWIGTLEGLNTFDRQTKKITSAAYKHRPDDIHTLSGDAVTAIYEDKEGYLWMGTWTAGLNRMDKKSGKITRFPIGGQGTSTFEGSVFLIHEDKQGTLWAATWKDGLYEFDRKKERFTEHLKGIGAQDLWEDESGNFWIPTEGKGFLYYNPKSRKIEKSFGFEDGIPNLRIYNISADGLGNLWLTTANGLSRFNLATEEFTNFDATDGLASSTFLQSSSASFQTLDGKLYFGTDKGLTFFAPIKLAFNEVSPSISITNVKVNGESVSLKKEVLVLSHEQRNISFDFLGIHFTKPAENHYSYQCEPYDKAWTEIGTQRTIRYTNLDPGTYTFKVKSANSDGVWNTTPAIFRFVIQPPWWRTWWAYTLFFSLILGLIYLIYRFQINKQLAETESIRLREINQLKSRLYTNITHEFRTPLTIILGVSKQLKTQLTQKAIPNLEMIQRNGQLLLELINQMLDLSKLEAGKLELNYTHGDVVNFLKYLTESFHSVAENRAIQLHFLSDLEELHMDYDVERLQQVFFNLISNALKFTPDGGNIYLQISKHESDFVALKIRDTGSGIPEEELSKIFDRFYQIDDGNTRKGGGTGIGLALVQELVKLMEGNIQVKSKIGKGTEFTLRFPIQNRGVPTARNMIPTEVVFSSQPSTKKELISTLIDAPKILIIEDNEDVLKYLTNSLTSHFQIETAADGDEGIQKALKIIPDLIISDVMMPIKDGFEVCETLKKDRRSSHIPIILLTAKADISSKLEGLEQGANVYLAKPFHEEELLLNIHNLLQQRDRLKNHYLFVSGLSSNGTDTETKPQENTFVKQVKTVIYEHLADNTFTVSQLSKEVALSSSQLHRKLTALTGYSAVQMIRMIRLKEAQRMLHNPEVNIATVAYDCGFNDPDYFSKVFKKEYGKSPSEFRVSK